MSRLHRTIWIAGASLGLLWGGASAVAAPKAPPQQIAQTQQPVGPAGRPAARKPGFFKRMRRFRTRSKPRVYRLLRLHTNPKKLFKLGKYVYWNPSADWDKGSIYRFKLGHFNRKIGARLLRKSNQGRYRKTPVVVRLQKPIQSTFTREGKKRSGPIIPCHIKRLYKRPKATAKGRRKHPLQLPADQRAAFRLSAVGHWAQLDLMRTSHRVKDGRLWINTVAPSRRRTRRASFYRVSLPASVLTAFQKQRAKGAVKTYLIRFRIAGLKVYRRYPAKHWMPHPHGGFRHHELTGAAPSR